MLIKAIIFSDLDIATLRAEQAAAQADHMRITQVIAVFEQS